MITIDVPTIKGIKKEVAYNISDFPYTLLKNLPIIKKAKKGEFYNVSSAFDIETTTIEPPKHEDEYIYNPYGFMYHWQFCINNMVVFGRTWEEFTLFLDNIRSTLHLNENRKLIVYVHILGYEFQFMKDFLQIDNIFAKDKRKPMKVLSQGIEFRCSYFLSNMSLNKFCENSKLCIHYKMQDTYDYKKLRTPTTPLTNDELAYCYNDVRGLCECIDTKLLDDDIATIPLTNTGYVRREYRKAMKTKQLRHKFVSTQLNAEQYKMLKRAFRGGNTHANRFLSNVVLDNVYSFDISSSYPTSMAIDEYPIGAFMECKLNNQNKLDYFIDNYCVVMDITFFDITVKENEVIPYIPISHCWERSGVVNDNGRVLHADMITITLTNIDLKIIRDTYNYKGFTVNKSMYATKGKLPIELRSKMMEFFTNKTMLKNIEGKEYEYMKSKNMLNSTFGMMVTSIDHSEVTYDANTMKWGEIEPNLVSALEQFYKSRNNFLSYQWGVFVTANSRLRLQKMLKKVGGDVVYTDTDSIKFVNKKHIKEFEELNNELIKQAETNDIQAFVDRDGERFYLGTWDNDGNYLRYKTLGSKKYCYEKMKKGKKVFEITVSGMSKKKGAERVGNIDNFEIGKTYTDVGRTTSWYNDEKPHKITINGDTFTSASNIGILDTTYTLGVTNEYWELIKGNFNK